MYTFKCKECGKEMTVTGKEEIVRCEYCGSDQKSAISGDGKKISSFRLVCLGIVSLICFVAMIFYMISAIYPKKTDKNAKETSAINTVAKETPVSETQISETQSIYEIVQQPSESVAVFNKLNFGKYEQNTSSDGKEDISWIILDRVDGKMLIISEYVLDTKNYNDTPESVTWEESSIRKWLNKDFLRQAFSISEQNKIQKVHNSNKNNYEYDTFGGNDTEDKVFLLSEEEYKKYFKDYNTETYGELSFFCMPTEYAKEKGVVAECDFGKGAIWWLRTPGGTDRMATCVALGGLKKDGAPVDSVWKGDYGGRWYVGVRPAMWITE
ncbi:MAG: DUF6273 domain-containing protein [Clostridia bacterium]|nr:DUF6273 domain-containing protein [Clostridia bacterium]